MNDKPSHLIEFDPLTWQPISVYFKSNSDEETRCLQEILMRGVKCETVKQARVNYDARLTCPQKVYHIQS